LVGHAFACPYSHAISTPRFSLRRRGGRIAAGIARLRFTGKLIAAVRTYHALRGDVREADARLAPPHRLRINAIGSVWSRHAWQPPPATATQR
jgi:hypothetical protein